MINIIEFIDNMDAASAVVMAVAAIIVLVAAFIALSVKDVKSKLWSTLLILTQRAEKVYGGKTGALKKSWVVQAILGSAFYVALPAFVRSFVSAKAIGGLVDKFVETVFKKIQKELSARLAKYRADNDNETDAVILEHDTGAEDALDVYFPDLQNAAETADGEWEADI